MSPISGENTRTNKGKALKVPKRREIKINDITNALLSAETREDARRGEILTIVKNGVAAHRKNSGIVREMLRLSANMDASLGDGARIAYEVGRFREAVTPAMALMDSLVDDLCRKVWKFVGVYLPDDHRRISVPGKPNDALGNVLRIRGFVPAEGKSAAFGLEHEALVQLGHKEGSPALNGMAIQDGQEGTVYFFELAPFVPPPGK